MIQLNKSLLVIVISSLITVALTASAQENPCSSNGIDRTLSEGFPLSKVPYPVLANFRQPKFLTVDPTGDEILFQMGQQLGKHIVWEIDKDPRRSVLDKAIHASVDCSTWFFGDAAAVPPSPVPTTPWQPYASDTALINHLNVSDAEKSRLQDELKNGSLKFEGHKLPLSNEGMVKMLARVIQQETEKNGIEPKLGSVHRWSPEFLAETEKETHHLPSSIYASKLLLSLAKGVTLRFMITEKESDLRTWILAQNEESIEMPELFRKSYQLNQGDVYLALLTIENVLAFDWSTGNREELPLTRRLTRITNEFGAVESRFGNWYHLFGIMLFGFAEPVLCPIVMGNVEVVGSQIMNRFTPAFQKHSLNRNGGIIGNKLHDLIQSGSLQSMQIGDEALSKSEYLNLDEDFTAKILEKGKKASHE